MQVPMIRPYLGEEEEQAVIDVLRSGWLIQGKKVEELEGMIAAVAGTDYAEVCSSCTTALHMALLAVGVKPSDEVLVPAFTFVASWNAIEYCGATPIPVDIEPETFNMSPEHLEEVYDRHPLAKSIMPVHLFGLGADMQSIMDVMVEHQGNWPALVEDAACALGSLIPLRGDDGKVVKAPAGAIGQAGCFSFHPRKPIATGEGGAVTTSYAPIAKEVHRLKDFGFEMTNLERHNAGATLMPEVNVLGYNYRMTDIQAAIGVEQMKKFPWIISEKQRRAAIYDEELAGVEWLMTPKVPDGFVHTYQSYACLVGGIPDNPDAMHEVDRASVMAQLKEMGVATRQGTHAVPWLGYYAKKYGYRREDFPNTSYADEHGLTIPLYPHMPDEEQEYVIESIKAVKV